MVDQAEDDLDTWIDDGGLPEGTVPICLKFALVSQVEDLERDLLEVKTNAHTMADKGRARRIAEQIEEAREKMRANSRIFRLRGLEWTALQALIGAHQPRDKDEVDRIIGFNRETLFPALIRECLFDPKLTDAQWARLQKKLSAGQFEQLSDKAWGLSRRKIDIPFSFASSAELASGETSRQPSA